MKLFICANENFALRVNGEFLGNFCGAAGIDDFSPAYVEVMPHSGLQCANFFVDYSDAEISNGSIYSLPDGMLVKLHFNSPAVRKFKPLMQKRFTGGVLITAFADGATRIVAENSSQAEAVEVPFDCNKFIAEQFGEFIIVRTDTKPTFAAVFSCGKNLNVAFANTADEIQFTPIFRTVSELGGIERAKVTCEWQTNSVPFIPKVTNVSFGNPWMPSSPFRFTQRAFFQRIFNRLSVTEMLTENLKTNEGRLSEYLGNFTEILPDFCNEKGVCLAYGNEGTRRVKTFTVELENNLICNLHEI